jgi:L-asparaginase II
MREHRGHPGRVRGAGTLLCLAIPDTCLGVAIRDTGGASRSLGPVAVAVLESFADELPQVLDRLRRALGEPVLAFAGIDVGTGRPAVVMR